VVITKSKIIYEVKVIANLFVQGLIKCDINILQVRVTGNEDWFYLHWYPYP